MLNKETKDFPTKNLHKTIYIYSAFMNLFLINYRKLQASYQVKPEIRYELLPRFR